MLTLHTFSRAIVLAAFSLSCAAVSAQPTPADGAAPIVELMPLIMKKEAELKLTPAQVQAFADYRKKAVPVRTKIQQDILSLRGQLRTAILDNHPEAERQALIQKIADAEVAHIKGREKCAEFARKTLTEDQFAQLKSLYLTNLPPVKK